MNHNNEWMPLNSRLSIKEDWNVIKQTDAVLEMLPAIVFSDKNC